MKRRLTVATYTIQLVMLGLALYCGYSRVLDQRHHPTDVMAGSVLGALVGWAISSSLDIQSFYQASKEE